MAPTLIPSRQQVNNGANSPLSLTSSLTTEIPLTLKGFSGQSSDLFDIKDSNNNYILAVKPITTGGNFQLGGIFALSNYGNYSSVVNPNSLATLTSSITANSTIRSSNLMSEVYINSSSNYDSGNIVNNANFYSEIGNNGSTYGFVCAVTSKVYTTNTGKVDLITSNNPTVTIAGSSVSGDVHSLFAQTQISSGTVTNFIGATALIQCLTPGTKTITNAIGLDVRFQKEGGGTANTFTNIYGIRISEFTTVTTTSTITTNRYGLYLEAPLGTATNDYGIYQNGTQTNKLNGKLLVPDEVYSSAWNAKLEVPTKNAVYNILSSYYLFNNSSSIAFGNNSYANGLGSGFGDTFIGTNSGYSVTSGNFNNALGNNSLYSLTTGSENIAIGSGAAYSLTTTGQNTIIGRFAGYSNVGSGNVFLGYTAGYSETGSNKLYISNSTTATPLIYGDFSTSSLTFNGAVSASSKITAVTDIEVTTAVNGIILKSSDGTRHRITVNNANALVVTSL